MNTKLYETIRSSLWSRGSARPVAGLRAYVVMLVAAVTLVVAALPAGAIDDDPPEPPPVLGCLTKVKGGMSASSPAVTDGQSVTVSWSTNVPAGCTGVTVKATGPGLYSTVRSDSKTLVPVPASNNYAMYQLMAYKGVQSWPVANVAIKVNPATSTAYDRKTVYINHSSQVLPFLDAIGTANTTIMLADHVNLDLSGRHTLHISPGVHIVGGRSSTKPGPRLFTTTKPVLLFTIGEYSNADGVRITGIRLDGGDMGIADPDAAGPIAIRVTSSVNVEIGNNEIYGWSGVGVQVVDSRDGTPPNRINLENATAVWVHDNYIHHNRHWREQGYGVQANVSAYVLIERNVFDYNRHAIEASNTDGIGYLAYNNLVLEGGGENCCLGVALQHTHQFDVHGTDSCGFKGYYCGEAGEYFDYRYNTLRYTAGDALKVRGRPNIRADVAHNIFGHNDPYYAIVQTDGDNLIRWENVFGRRVGGGDDDFAPCDFDSDGHADKFMSTGRTWWFKGVTGQWNYLNTSDKVVADLTFQDVNVDGRCDVKDVSTLDIFSGGRSKRLVGDVEVAAARTDVVWQPTAGGDAKMWVLNPELTGVEKEHTVTLAADQQVVGTGDFNADGASDLLVRNAAGQVSVLLLDHHGHVRTPIGGRSAVKGDMPSSTQVAGVGDFNADGRSDILWRKENGQLLIWFAGESGNSALVNYNNEVNVDPDTTVVTPKEAPVPVDWKVKGIGDFNGDGYSDILWRHDGGQVAIWYMLHAQHVGDAYPGGTDPSRVWEIQGVGDFDADGSSDILWRATGGELAMWFKGRYEYGQAYPTWQNRAGWVTQLEWQIRAVGDFNADGRADILWRYADGTVSIWKMDGGWYTGESAYLPMDNAWQLRGLLAQAPQRIDLQ